MSLLVYRIILFFYKIILIILSPFNEKANLFVSGRKHLFASLKTDFDSVNEPVAWFHCASLGEFEQGRPIIEAFKEEYPGHLILLTFFSPSGYEVRKNYKEADFVYYLPMDTPSNASKFIQITKPAVAFFVKYEFWFFYLRTLRNKSIPVLSVSSIFRKEQIYFKWFGGFYRKILKGITYFFVQGEKSRALLNEINIAQVDVAGDTRFDRVKSLTQSSGDIAGLAEFKGSEQLMIIGSAWKEDMAVLAQYINDSQMKFIVAPHEITENFVRTIEQQLTVSCIRYSKPQKEWSKHKVLIIDNIGLLSKLYGYADYAYVGGAFGAGLHNILEAAVFGIPVFFGNKNYKKFNEAVDLINLGGAKAISGYSDFEEAMNFLQNKEAYEITCQVCKTYVQDNIGATERIMKYTRNILSQP